MIFVHCKKTHNVNKSTHKRRVNDTSLLYLELGNIEKLTQSQRLTLGGFL